MKAVLGFEDGDFVVGEGFGVKGECAGELVFNTQMTGYMESLTDPSYFGQILMFTFPQIGNYGVDPVNFQNPHVCALGCIAKEICEKPAYEPSVRTFFEENGLLGMTGVDTRALTIKARVHGTMRAALVVGSDDGAYAVALAKKTPTICDIVPIPEVSCREPYRIPGTGKRIAVIDLGIKKNMLTSLSKRNGDLYVFPYNATADQVRACTPDALFVSNGPGDPSRLRMRSAAYRIFWENSPSSGSAWATRSPHLRLVAIPTNSSSVDRGANRPVSTKTEGSSSRRRITVLPSIPVLPTEGCRVSYTNVNDGTVEGFENDDLCLTTVQFHPEAHGGPRDTEAPFL